MQNNKIIKKSKSYQEEMKYKLLADISTLIEEYEIKTQEVVGCVMIMSKNHFDGSINYEYNGDFFSNITDEGYEWRKYQK